MNTVLDRPRANRLKNAKEAFNEYWYRMGRSDATKDFLKTIDDEIAKGISKKDTKVLSPHIDGAIFILTYLKQQLEGKTK